MSHLLHLAGQLVQLGIEGLSLRVSLSTPAVLGVSSPWSLGATGRWWWKQVLSVVAIGVPCRATQDLGMSNLVVMPLRCQDDTSPVPCKEVLFSAVQGAGCPMRQKALRVKAAPCQAPWLAITVQ